MRAEGSKATADDGRDVTRRGTGSTRKGSAMQRHTIDALALFAGLVFTMIAVLSLTDAVTISLVDLRWIGPALLVGFGVALVVSTATGTRRRSDDTESSQ